MLEKLDSPPEPPQGIETLPDTLPEEDSRPGSIDMSDMSEFEAEFTESPAENSEPHSQPPHSEQKGWRKWVGKGWSRARELLQKVPAQFRRGNPELYEADEEAIGEEELKGYGVKGPESDELADDLEHETDAEQKQPAVENAVGTSEQPVAADEVFAQEDDTVRSAAVEQAAVSEQVGSEEMSAEEFQAKLQERIKNSSSEVLSKRRTEATKELAKAFDDQHAGDFDELFSEWMSLNQELEGRGEQQLGAAQLWRNVEKNYFNEHFAEDVISKATEAANALEAEGHSEEAALERRKADILTDVLERWKKAQVPVMIRGKPTKTVNPAPNREMVWAHEMPRRQAIRDAGQSERRNNALSSYDGQEPVQPPELGIIHPEAAPQETPAVEPEKPEAARRTEPDTEASASTAEPEENEPQASAESEEPEAEEEPSEEEVEEEPEEELKAEEEKEEETPASPPEAIDGGDSLGGASEASGGKGKGAAATKTASRQETAQTKNRNEAIGKLMEMFVNPSEQLEGVSQGLVKELGETLKKSTDEIGTIRLDDFAERVRQEGRELSSDRTVPEKHSKLATTLDTLWKNL